MNYLYAGLIGFFVGCAFVVMLIHWREMDRP